MWIVIVTTDTGDREDGNVYYSNFVVFPTMQQGIDACRLAMPHRSKEKVDVDGKWMSFKDVAGNLLFLKEVSAEIELALDPDDYEE